MVRSWTLACFLLGCFEDWDRETIYDNTIKAMCRGRMQTDSPICFCEAYTALAAEAWDLAIMPIFGGLCPHNDFAKANFSLGIKGITKLIDLIDALFRQVLLFGGFLLFGFCCMLWCCCCGVGGMLVGVCSGD